MSPNDNSKERHCVPRVFDFYSNSEMESNYLQLYECDPSLVDGVSV